jgi:hypothetical protein
MTINTSPERLRNLAREYVNKHNMNDAAFFFGLSALGFIGLGDVPSAVRNARAAARAAIIAKTGSYIDALEVGQ